jgi:hypothetical protein
MFASPQVLRVKEIIFFAGKAPMSKNDSYVSKSQAIRTCVADHPSASPQRIVELLAAEGLRVSPAHVIVIQTLARAERTDRVAAVS